MKFCPCGDRALKDCPGEWESGCDLGANEMYVGVTDQVVGNTTKVYIVVNFYGYITAVFADKDKACAHLDDGDEIQEWKVL